jgi:hypothetical protein
LQAFVEQADALSGFVMGELAHCGDMARGKGSNGMAHHALLDVHISSTLHLQLAALKVGQAPDFRAAVASEYHAVCMFCSRHGRSHLGLNIQTCPLPFIYVEQVRVIAADTRVCSP